MNLSATLTPAEVGILSDHQQTLRDAGLTLVHQTLDNKDRNETPFELGLRIKTTLDALEEGFITEPNERALALLINCEHRLWHLYADGPLDHNPFLSHWVEALQRLDRLGKIDQDATEGLSPGKLSAVRVSWIKTLLQQKDLHRWLESTPSDIYDSLVKETLSKPFNLQPFIQMLEDAGIYEKITVSEVGTSAVDENHKAERTPSKIIVRSPEDALQEEKDDILLKLDTQPEAAIFEITRLPIAIPYLDFLTTLLADRTLEKHSIDPAPIITQYIQHALRTVELSEKPPSPSLEADTAVDGHAGHRADAEYGKDAQSRYIRLLLLFIKSLIRKGLVELDVLYYEIAEITVRYVWIKEVREFRTWAEEGIDEDATAR